MRRVAGLLAVVFLLSCGWAMAAESGKPAPVYGYLGVVVSAAPEGVADEFGLANGEGVIVDRVEKDSPAEKAGIQAGDMITKVGDQLIFSQEQLSRLISHMAPGSEVRVEFIHEKGKTAVATVKLGSTDRAPGAQVERPDLRAGGGLHVQGLRVEIVPPAGGGVVRVVPRAGGGLTIQQSESVVNGKRTSTTVVRVNGGGAADGVTVTRVIDGEGGKMSGMVQFRGKDGKLVSRAFDGEDGLLTELAKLKGEGIIDAGAENTVKQAMGMGGKEAPAPAAPPKAPAPGDQPKTPDADEQPKAPAANPPAAGAAAPARDSPEQKLMAKGSVNFVETSLIDVLSFLKSMTGVPVLVDPDLAAEAPDITLKAENVAWRDLLEQVARQTGATYEVTQDGVHLYQADDGEEDEDGFLGPEEDEDEWLFGPADDEGDDGFLGPEEQGDEQPGVVPGNEGGK